MTRIKKEKKPVELFGQFGTLDQMFKDRKEFMALCKEAFNKAVEDFNRYLKGGRE